MGLGELDRLLNSTLSLAAVAEEAGFADASSFSRAYRCRFQQTPGSVRSARLQAPMAPFGG